MISGSAVSGSRVSRLEVGGYRVRGRLEVRGYGVGGFETEPTPS